MNLDALYPGRFLKGGQLAGVTKIEVLCVESVQLDTDSKKKKKEKPKAILTARMRNPSSGQIEPVEIVWCKVNGLLTAELYGKESDAWIGKVLFIRFDPTVRFGADTPGGIRVCGAPASVLPVEKTVTIKITRKVGGDFREVHTLRPNGGLVPPTKQGPTDGSAAG